MNDDDLRQFYTQAKLLQASYDNIVSHDLPEGMGMVNKACRRLIKRKQRYWNAKLYELEGIMKERKLPLEGVTDDHNERN